MAGTWLGLARICAIVGAWLIVAATAWQARLADRQFRHEAELRAVRIALVGEVPWWRPRARRHGWREATKLLTPDERAALDRWRHQQNAWALLLAGAFWVSVGTTIDQLVSLY